MLEFHDEGHLYSNCLFYILTIYHKCLRFQFLGSLICMQIPFLTEIQNGRIICEENGRILIKECLVLSLLLEVKSLVCQLFYILTFTVNFVFPSSAFVPYVCTFPS